MWAVWSLAYPSILGGLTEGRASCWPPMCCSHGVMYIYRHLNCCI